VGTTFSTVFSEAQAQEAAGDIFGATFTGVGPFLHDDPRDRPEEVYGGQVTIHTGGEHRSWLYVPIVPKA
jgi:hypothetical protein